MLKNRKGFTMVEVVIAAGFVGVIVLLSATLITGDYKRLKQAEREVAVQDSVQYSLDRMSQVSYECEGVGEIIDTSSISRLEDTSPAEISLLRFVFTDEDDNETPMNVTLLDGELKCVSTTSGLIFSISNVVACKATPLPDGSSFEDATGLVIEVTSQVADREITSETSVYFRNKK